jgi:hypothetical protein
VSSRSRRRSRRQASDPIAPTHLAQQLLVQLPQVLLIVRIGGACEHGCGVVKRCVGVWFRRGEREERSNVSACSPRPFAARAPSLRGRSHCAMGPRGRIAGRAPSGAAIRIGRVRALRVRRGRESKGGRSAHLDGTRARAGHAAAAEGAAARGRPRARSRPGHGTLVPGRPTEGAGWVGRMGGEAMTIRARARAGGLSLAPETCAPVGLAASRRLGLGPMGGAGVY